MKHPVGHNRIQKRSTRAGEAGHRQIKVLHLVTSLEVGGAQRGLLLGLPSFDRSRYEHIVCSVMDRMQMAPQFRSAGIEVHSLGLNRKTDIGVALRLRSLLRDLRVDILHTYLLHGNLLGRMVGRLVGVPIVIGSERTIGQARLWGRLATRLTNPLTDAVEVNSDTGARSIEVDLGVPREKIEVVRSGLELSAFRKGIGARDRLRTQFGISGHDHVVLILGRLRKVKGVEFGLRGFASAHTRSGNLRLLIAGDGDQREYLESLTVELGIESSVLYLGVRDDVPELIAAADSVLMPSLTEGFPRTAIEAMAAGKPVIATNVGGTPEAIDDGLTGLLVPPKDVQAIALAIEKLVEDDGLRARLGSAGMNQAVKNYSVDKYVCRLDELYQRFSAVRPRRPSDHDWSGD